LPPLIDPGRTQFPEKEKVLIAEIIEKVNSLFERELGDNDKLFV
jgi:type I restriction enzyme, R subunit